MTRGMTRIRIPLLALLAALLLAPPAQAVETGVNEALGQTRGTAQTASELRAGWVRLWASWETAQPSAGSWAPHIIADLNARVAALKARGIRVLVVVHRSPAWASGGRGGTAPPSDPASFGAAMGHFAATVPGVDAWELWNEQDGPDFFAGGPDPARYAAMVRAAYPAIKAVQPGDTVVTGGTVGNDMDFVEQLYQHGAQGSFDAVGVHTDTACLVDEPGFHYRDEQGRIGRYTFTGYREVHAVMAAHGDGGKPIWMTELGWSTQSTEPKSCNVGAKAGTKPLGVTEAKQAEFLSAAYSCLAADPYIGVALWFGLQDVPHSKSLGGYGLYRRDGSAKPSAAAFKGLADGIGPSACGGIRDKAAPTIEIRKPTAGAVFRWKLPIDVRATDAGGGVGVRRIEIWEGGRRVRVFGHRPARMRSYWPAKEWRFGPHTLTFKAFDEAGNMAEASVTVTRVRRMPKAATAAALAVQPVDAATARVTGRVRVTPPGPRRRVKGRARVVFQQWVAQPDGTGTWVTRHRVRRSARRAVALTKRLEPGRWRVFLAYGGHRHFKRSSSAPVEFVSA